MVWFCPLDGTWEYLSNQPHSGSAVVVGIATALFWSLNNEMHGVSIFHYSHCLMYRANTSAEENSIAIQTYETKSSWCVNEITNLLYLCISGLWKHVIGNCIFIGIQGVYLVKLVFVFFNGRWTEKIQKQSIVLMLCTV